MIAGNDAWTGRILTSTDGIGDDTHYKNEYARIRQVWQDAGRGWDSENGVEAWKSIRSDRVGRVDES